MGPTPLRKAARLFRALDNPQWRPGPGFVASRKKRIVSSQRFGEGLGGLLKLCRADIGAAPDAQFLITRKVLMGLVVAACHHKRIQVRSRLFEAKFHFSVFRGMFFPAAACVNEKSIGNAND